jgi:hypothetical protein
MLLSACAREHAKDGAGPSDPNAIQDGAEDEQSGGTGGSMSAAGQGASGQSASQEVTGGTNASSAIDAGASAVDADSGITTPTDAGTETEPPVSADAGEPHESFVGCRGPLDPGCAECKDGDDGYNRAQEGTDWYNWSSVDGTCEPDCPACASCSYRNEADAIELGHRPECEPCVDPGVDPCFGPSSCGCYCSLKSWLSVACPTLF